MNKIAILQPFIPHYREDFFKGVSQEIETDLYCFEKSNKISKQNFNLSSLQVKSAKNLTVGPFLLYNPFILIKKEYKTLVLMMHFAHITTWLLLLTKAIHKKKIFLWGQGISVKRFLKEEKKPNILFKWMVSLADGVWLYTKKEQEQWLKLYPHKQIIALNNSVSDVDKILSYSSTTPKEVLKEKYKIYQNTIFIFCARFTNAYRRTDLLEDIIRKLDNQKYGFIIIGDGEYKPNFAGLSNVYDFGSVYDRELKNDLFTLADWYLQPGWVGLSIVEALAYGKPVITFKRSQDTLQCVEYSYLTHLHNALIIENIDELISFLNTLNQEDFDNMCLDAKAFAKQNLTMQIMVSNALKSL